MCLKVDHVESHFTSSLRICMMASYPKHLQFVVVVLFFFCLFVCFLPEAFAFVEKHAQIEEGETCQGVNIPGFSLTIVGG